MIGLSTEKGRTTAITPSSSSEDQALSDPHWPQVIQVSRSLPANRGTVSFKMATQTTTATDVSSINAAVAGAGDKPQAGARAQRQGVSPSPPLYASGPPASTGR